MTELSRTAIILLAAGLSRRHPGHHKLLRSFRGKPLGLHAATTIGSLPAQVKIAVLSASTDKLGNDLVDLGFEIARNDAPADGLSSSIEIGVRAAREKKAEAILICLADMPFVSSHHLQSLAALLDPAAGYICVGSVHPGGTAVMPPAAFTGEAVDYLSTIPGDQGAREILQFATSLAAGIGELRDFDDPGDFDQF